MTNYIENMTNLKEGCSPDMLKEVHRRGVKVSNCYNHVDFQLIGLCEIVRELQQEVATLKEQLNTIGKNI